MQLPNKLVEETIMLTFDFTKMRNAMGINDSVLGNPVLSMRSIGGGGNAINVLSTTPSGLRYRALAEAGEPGVSYDARCSATFSNGERRTLRGVFKVI